MNKSTVFIIGLLCGALICLAMLSRYKISTAIFKDVPVFYKFDRFTGQTYMSQIMGYWDPVDEPDNVQYSRVLFATTVTILTIPFLLWIWLKKKEDVQSSTSKTWKSRIRKAMGILITIFLTVAFNIYLWLLIVEI